MSGSPGARFRRVDAIFDAVLDLPADEHDAFIASACGDDRALRGEVRRLLQAYHRSGSFLESSAVQLAAPLLEDNDVLAASIPDRIGPFRIVRAIGAGGMGQVFLGERADGQFEQRVAIKLIQHGAPGLVRRFLDERRILAMLEHPRIARLIDGGITAAGLPYFAMEFVEGEPIDVYCAKRNLSLERRLALFIDVCDAVCFAHHHLVIHRDLKPSNILVTPDGQVKLLDFGIAKLLDPQEIVTADSPTEFHAMTPEFAAPEQIRGQPINTCTDIYSLGVLLYLLLTGQRPYDVRGKSLAEIERIVCEFDPPRPSSLAPAPLRRRLRGDLDLIVTTALHKKPGHRYLSADLFAQDVQRYLRGDAILARADSRGYRFRKFIGRHRIGTAVASVLLLALAGAGSRERVLRNRAELEARKARAVEDFLVQVFDVSDPYASKQADGGSITARELLERGASRIDSTLAGQPEVQAELRSVFGRVYTNLGLFDKATPLLRRSLAQRSALHELPHADVAQDMDLLGAALVKQDRYEEAEPLLRKSLEQRRRLFGKMNAATAESAEHLATLLEQRNDHAAAEQLHREALAIREAVFGDSTVEVANSLSNLGLIHFRKGEYEKAEPLYRRALDIKVRELGENHPLTAVTMQNLAQTLQMRGSFDEAETFFRRSLTAKRKALGNAHPSVTIGLNNLGNLLARALGRLDEGEALTREALALDRQIFGEQHSYVAASLGNLGVILILKGEFTEAEKLLRQAEAINRSLFGDTHATLGYNYGYLGQIRFQLGDVAGAVTHLREALRQYRQILGNQHVNTLVTMINLARVLTEVGSHEEAQSLAHAARDGLDPQNRMHRRHYVAAQRVLGAAALAQGRTDSALRIFEETVGLARREFGEQSWRTADVQLAYGKALTTARRRAEAEPLLRAAYGTLQAERRSQPRLAAQAAAAIQELALR